MRLLIIPPCAIAQIRKRPEKTENQHDLWTHECLRSRSLISSSYSLKLSTAIFCVYPRSTRHKASWAEQLWEITSATSARCAIRELQRARKVTSFSRLCCLDAWIRTTRQVFFTPKGGKKERKKREKRWTCRDRARGRPMRSLSSLARVAKLVSDYGSIPRDEGLWDDYTPSRRDRASRRRRSGFGFAPDSPELAGRPRDPRAISRSRMNWMGRE